MQGTFARLRFHYHLAATGAAPAADEALHETLQPIIARAIAASAVTCQVCGAHVERSESHRWSAVLCEAHDASPWRRYPDISGVSAEDQDRAFDGDAVALIGDALDLPSDLWPSDAQPPAPRGEHRLYHLRAVADALGRPADLDEEDLAPAKAETEHDERLTAILRRGEPATWRDLARPDREMPARLDTLDAQAPHMAAVTSLVRRHVLAALNVGLPLSLPPTMMLGEPGLGKSWYLSQLGGILRVPTRTYPMASSTLGEGLQGSHPSWRNAGLGVVAKTLMQEPVANPLILVDEIDKPSAGGWNTDPYRPFYALLEPAGARSFRDEYFGFELDASHVMWILAGNSVAPLPDPIRDRLTVIEIPALTRDTIRAVAASIYAEVNARMRMHFAPEMTGDVLERLLDRTPRAIRVAIQDGMVSAAAEGRNVLMPYDIAEPRSDKVRRIGFFSSHQ